MPLSTSALTAGLGRTARDQSAVRRTDPHPRFTTMSKGDYRTVSMRIARL
jgi:hypothetical protein